jgi:hypothetical protein
MWLNLFKPEYQKWRWIFCLALPIYIYLFVSFVEPFKNDKITYVWASTNAYISHSILNFILVTVVAIVTLIFFPKYFPKYFLPDNFTFQRFCTLTTMSAIAIEIGYFFTNKYFFNYDITLLWFLIFLFRVTISSFLFAGVPFVIGFLYVVNYFIEQPQSSIHSLEPREHSDINEIDKSIFETGTPQYKPNLAPKILHFSDNSSKRNLEVPLDSLFYITSAQNYIEVYYQNKNAVNTRQVLRSSLKAIEEEMIANDTNSPLFRCHKAFIVNREKVIELRGPSKMAQLILEGIEVTIPVSRQKYAELETQLAAPNCIFS